MRARIRTLDPTVASEVELVAHRMRETLVEVLGEERGGGMYSHEWLVARVKWHLDPRQSTGQVFVTEAEDGRVSGHAIVRTEDDGAGNTIGLFSTIYVEPESRNRGLAKALIARGEDWMIEQGLDTAVTYTDAGNAKLHRLFLREGYTISVMPDDFVKLAKRLHVG